MHDFESCLTKRGLFVYFPLIKASENLSAEMERIPILPCRVRAVFSWAAESPQDLGFIEGDYIDVLNTGDGDWWTGRLKRNKMIGTFPRNYVQYLDENQKTAPHPDVAAQLAIKQTLPAEVHHNKTTKDILADIGMEMNDLDIYETPSFIKDHSPSIPHPPYPNESVFLEDSDDEVGPPPPPPHLVVSNSSSHHSRNDDSYHSPYSKGYSRNIEMGATMLGDEETPFITEQGEKTLMQPLSNSPLVDEIPFNPQMLVDKRRVPADQRNRTISGRSQSFDMGSPSPATKTKGLVRKLLRGIIDNTDIKRSSSMTDLKRPDLKDIRHLEVPKLSSLKFWKQETDDLVPPNMENGQAAANMAVQKVLLDPQWMDSAQDLYRAKTLSGHEMAKRRRRLELEGVNTMDPFALLERYGTDFHDYYLENFDHVDDPIMTMSTWPQLWTPAVLASSKIGRQFKDPIDRLRGIFMLCAAYITYMPSAAGPDNSDNPAALSRTMQTKMATPFELAYAVQSMCHALEIDCKVVRGHYRPADGSASGIPHAWNVVSVEGEWRLMDASVASPTFPGSHEDEINTFYFLTPPTKMIFTHIPNEPLQQYLTPPLPTSAAVNLPIAAPGAFRDQVTFVDFWSGMTIFNDLEPCEFTMTLPNDQLDIVAEVEASLDASYNGASSLNSSTSSRAPKTLALSQPFWRDNKRFFKVKAVLPEGSSKGLLRIYTIEREFEQRPQGMMVLAYTLSLNHRGKNAPFEFVSRFGHPRGLRQDIYITEPQCRLLKGGQNYKFVLHAHPSRGVSAGSGLVPTKLAMQSPSGRITKLVCTNPHDTCTSWTAQIRTLEVGCWRAVVRTDDGEGWAPFSEWYCS